MQLDGGGCRTTMAVASSRRQTRAARPSPEMADGSGWGVNVEEGTGPLAAGMDG